MNVDSLKSKYDMKTILTLHHKNDRNGRNQKEIFNFRGLLIT